MAKLMLPKLGGGGSADDQKITNVAITVTDITAVVEGQTVTAVCNGKIFSSIMKNGVCKIYSSEVGNYTITAGDYTVGLICPYFGQFSTDIYSGTLNITCIEDGGNGKTCNVRSCDDNYEFTDNYNLTQTFGGDLELTFLGIPTGKYVITVDDRYRFFKEITTIQEINNVEVELKQWLFKEGDQCIHNTGGWMKCLISGSKRTGWSSLYGQSYDRGNHTEEIRIGNSISIDIEGNSYVDSYNVTGRFYYGRPEIIMDAYCGTQKESPIMLSLYKQMHIQSSKQLSACIRSGSQNTESTTVSTATILSSGTANPLSLSAPNSKGYIVIGTHQVIAGYGRASIDGNTGTLSGGFEQANNPGNSSLSFSASISQVYMI